MKPLFKWPGGKSRELVHIRPLVPAFDRYLEPFVGGGALYFDLEPEQAAIADTSQALMNFYGHVGTDPANLRDRLMAYEHGRAAMHSVADAVSEQLVADHLTWRDDNSAADEHARAVMAAHRQAVRDLTPVPFDAADLAQLAETAVAAKLARIRRLEVRTGQPWTRADVATQVRTALQAAFYTLVRDRHEPVDDGDASARFFYLREFCYGGMFRYGRDGNFNVPYGGASYNDKNFAGKAERVTSEAVHALLARTDVAAEDFGAFFDRIGVRESDFVFLDPPYDTSFSTYDQLAFGVEEQVRLADVFASLPCPALLVIQKTPFVEQLYGVAARRNPSIVLEEYEKTYAFNIKGRHDRKVEHLLIRNYAV